MVRRSNRNQLVHVIISDEIATMVSEQDVNELEEVGDDLGPEIGYQDRLLVLVAKLGMICKEDRICESWLVTVGILKRTSKMISTLNS